MHAVLTHLGVECDELPEACFSDPKVEKHVSSVGDERTEHGPIDAHTDAKSTYDLCHRPSAGAQTRHVERRVFKMRELKAKKLVNLKLVKTGDTPADIFTKSLPYDFFKKFRAFSMNIM